MITWSYIVSFVLIVIAVLITDVLCTDSLRSSKQAVPFNANQTVWPQLGNQYYPSANSPWANPSHTTTPWPDLGGKRPNSNVHSNRHYPNSPTWVRPTAPVSTNLQHYPRQPTSFSGPRNENPRQPINQNAPPVTQNTGSGGEDEELRSFFESLLQRDVNNAAKYVDVNYQGRTTSRSPNDEAPLPLLSVSSQAYSIPTIAKLKMLHDNYILDTNVNENVTPQERNEENGLLDAILSTPIMQMVHDFLISKGKIGRDPQQFRNTMYEIWFTMYSRGGGKMGSSGFEHVFLAEIKNNGVSGLHNWVYFTDEEAKNNANYLGYMSKLDLGDKGAILKYHFTLRNVDKPVGAMFIGTSPEFEMALYSTCFLVRADRVCPVRLNGRRFIIRTFTYRYRGKSLIGSAFPEI